MIPTIVIGSVVLLLSALLYTRSSLVRRPLVCPSCDAAFIRMPQDQNSYDILVCPQCSNTVTAVHGGPSRFASCPDCHQRTLEIQATRLAPRPEAPIAVECVEVCHVCSYQDVRELPSEPLGQQRKGVVIPFPGRR